ncbi:MAG: RagB/SusD family nutrient uptake outer membrane protein, partial [Muribaculaceae bacterium]|nr:RagB/SusD family nutrient uptake outer membrane protein [Muribaculaceae bacterium]
FFFVSPPRAQACASCLVGWVLCIRVWLQDLIGNVEQKLGGENFYTRVVTDRDYLWPIPPGEIDKNPLLEQNPEW